jgi:hypothetical protein
MLRPCGLRGGRAQVTCAYKSSFSSREKPLVIQLVPKRSGFVQQALGSELRTAWSRDSLTTHPVSASSVRKLNQNGTQHIPPCQSTIPSWQCPDLMASQRSGKTLLENSRLRLFMRSDPEKRHQISYARVEAELAQHRSDLTAVMRLMIEKMRYRDPG